MRRSILLIAALALAATTAGEAQTNQPGLLVRAKSGFLSGESPFQAPAASRVVFEVKAYTRSDLSDTAVVTDYQWTVPDALVGRIPGLGQLILTTQAGVREAILFRRGSVEAAFELEVLGGPVDHLLIMPTDVDMEAGEAIDFDVLAADRYGNEFPLRGASVGWIVVPPELGEINSRTGRFVAAAAGEGFIVAVANWSLRYGATGTRVEGSGKVTVGDGVPRTFALHPNHPNPFNPETEIRFDLPERGHVELVVYNVSGQRVATLVANELSGGRHTYTWDASGQPSGVYVYALTSAGRTEARKMMLAK